MKTLITGAAGFIGSAVLRQILAASHDVRALIQPESDCRNLTGLSAEIVYGDITDRRSLDRAMDQRRMTKRVRWAPRFLFLTQMGRPMLKEGVSGLLLHRLILFCRY